MSERRVRRSAEPHLALNHLLDSVRQREGLPALALATRDEGLYIAGAGAADLELLGALGAAAPHRLLDGKKLHIRDVNVEGGAVRLTSLGRRAKADVDSAIQRILG